MLDIYISHSSKRADTASCWNERRQWIDGLLYGIGYWSGTFYFVLLYSNIFTSCCSYKASHIINRNWRSRNETEATSDKIELRTFCVEDSMMQFVVKWLTRLPCDGIYYQIIHSHIIYYLRLGKSTYSLQGSDITGWNGGLQNDWIANKNHSLVIKINSKL